MIIPQCKKIIGLFCQILSFIIIFGMYCQNQFNPNLQSFTKFTVFGQIMTIFAKKKTQIWQKMSKFRN